MNAKWSGFFCCLAGVMATAVLSAEEKPVAGWSWVRTESSLALRGAGGIVWQLVADPEKPKTYFHPLATVDGEVLTAFEPSDHRWHRGLWWSWKTINGVNYWEEDPRTGASAGRTELTEAKFFPGDDFKARAELRFRYHAAGQPPVMTEVRQLEISAPDEEGAYTIDWTAEFTAAGTGPVVLDRTPPPSRGGPGHGGYAGLSVRFPRDLEGWAFRSSEGIAKAGDGHGRPARWVDFSGPKAGVAVFGHPTNLRHPQPWYLSDKPSLLFFNPAILFDEPLELAAGATMTLRYRVLVHSKPVTTEQLETAWRSFAGEASRRDDRR